MYLPITLPHALFTLPVTIETNNVHSVLIARCVPKRRLFAILIVSRSFHAMGLCGSGARKNVFFLN